MTIFRISFKRIIIDQYIGYKQLKDELKNTKKIQSDISEEDEHNKSSLIV